MNTTTRKLGAKELVLAALFTAAGVILPIVFHWFGMAGFIFLPMHIPVLLCGYICGSRYGAACGVLVTVLSSLFTGMPPMYPIGVTMIFELLAYGALAGYTYKLWKSKPWGIFASLISTMIGGRIVLALVNWALWGMFGFNITAEAFLMGTFVTALPGIIIQLIAVPVIMLTIKALGRKSAA